MADGVQGIMENMAVELSLLVKCGLFTKQEVQSIVRKRRRFEYKLKRLARSKEDYLAYIDYELKLLRLRNARLARLRDNSDVAVNPLVKTGGTRHIHFIFDRALRKYPSDMRLWGAYIDFCAHHKAARAASRAMSRALQLHPEQTALWVFAARWELRTNKSLRAARGLFQRAVRTNPADLAVYVEYARLELDALLDIRRLQERQARRRQQQLDAEISAKGKGKGKAAKRPRTSESGETGMDNGDDDDKVKKEKEGEKGEEEEEEEEEDFDVRDFDDEDLAEEEERAMAAAALARKQSVSLETLALPEVEADAADAAAVRAQLERHVAAAAAEDTPLMQAAVPLAIYEHARAQLAGAARVDIAFLSLFSSYPTLAEHTVPPVEHALRADHAAQPAAWAALAAAAARRGAPAAPVFEEGLRAVPRDALPELWRFYIAFEGAAAVAEEEEEMEEKESKEETEGKTTATTKEPLLMNVEAAKRVAELCERCAGANALCERTCDAWLAAAAVLGDTALAQRVAAVATTHYPQLARYWQARIAVERCASTDSAEEAVARVLKAGLAAMTASEGPDAAAHAHALWLEGLRALVRADASPAALLSHCERALNSLAAKQPVVRTTDSDATALSGGSAGAFASAAFDILREHFSAGSSNSDTKQKQQQQQQRVLRTFVDGALRHSAVARCEAFVTRVLDWETAGRVDFARVRRLMLATLERAGSPLGQRCPALWLRYHLHEPDAGHMAEAAAVYAHARASLRDATTFVQMVASESS